MDIAFSQVETDFQIAALAALAGEIWVQHYTGILGEKQVAYMVDKFQSEKAIAGQIADGYRYYFILADGIPAGFTGICTLPEERVLFLSKLYLRKEMRGQGIARAALDFLTEICRGESLSKIRLTVNRHNDGSIAVYRHLGFATVREQKADIGGGFYMDDYVMEFSAGGR